MNGIARFYTIMARSLKKMSKIDGRMLSAQAIALTLPTTNFR